jgi:hypothetical protein
MNILELSKKAQSFYENTRSKSLYSGYEKNVLVREDYNNCLFVDSNYEPQPGDTIFRLRSINGKTAIDLTTQVPEAPSLEDLAIKGKFTRDEWLEMLDKTNGLIFSPEIDPRSQISEEVENKRLEHKILILNPVEGEFLKREIQRFWNNNLNTDEFIEHYKQNEI